MTLLSVVTTVALASAAGQAATAADRAILQDALRQFDQAVALNDDTTPKAQRLYREALRGFEHLVNDGVHNGDLYYNIANTHMRQGAPGRAIVNYRRALRLQPGDQDVRDNLRFARERCRTYTEGGTILETIFFWHYSTAPSARSRVALAAYVVCWSLLMLRLFLRRRYQVFTWLTPAVAIVAVSTGLSVAWDMHVAESRAEGVVTTDGSVLRKGNGEGYQPQLDDPLHEGVEFRILEQREDGQANPWYRVELRDGQDGWLRGDQAEVI